MSRARDLAGWIGAGTVTAGLFAGAAVAALRLPEMPTGAGPVVAVALDLSVGVVPVPPAPMAEAVQEDMPPRRGAQAPELPPLPVPDPDVPTPPAAAPDPVPVMEADAVAARSGIDRPLATTPPILPMASAQAVRRLESSPRPQARPDRLQSERPDPERSGQAPPATAGPSPVAAQTAPQAAGAQQAARPAEERRAAGGQVAARYGDLVMRQIAGLRRQRAPERGVVTVGFEIGADGGLRRVAVVASSGSEALDRVAVEHIRRAAPFPPPPQGAMTRFAFEFVGR